MIETKIDFVTRVKARMEEVRSKPRVKEKPLRVTKSLSGQVILVEWLCPECLGKPGWRRCIECKGKGILNGIEKAIYNESHYS